MNDSKFWVRMEKDTIVEGPMTLPGDYVINGKPVSDWTPAELLKLGWYPLIDEGSKADRKQFAVSPRYKLEVKADHVEMIRKVKPFPQAFLDAWNDFSSKNNG